MGLPRCQIKKEDFHNGNLYKARQLVPAPGLLRVHPGGQADHEVEDMDARPQHDAEADREGAKPANGSL